MDNKLHRTFVIKYYDETYHDYFYLSTATISDILTTYMSEE